MARSSRFIVSIEDRCDDRLNHGSVVIFGISSFDPLDGGDTLDKQEWGICPMPLGLIERFWTTLRLVE